jgi:hypothetical protein
MKTKQLNIPFTPSMLKEKVLLGVTNSLAQDINISKYIATSKKHIIFDYFENTVHKNDFLVKLVEIGLYKEFVGLVNVYNPDINKRLSDRLRLQGFHLLYNLLTEIKEDTLLYKLLRSENQSLNYNGQVKSYTEALEIFKGIDYSNNPDYFEEVYFYLVDNYDFYNNDPYIEKHQTYPKTQYTYDFILKKCSEEKYLHRLCSRNTQLSIILICALKEFSPKQLNLDINLVNKLAVFYSLDELLATFKNSPSVSTLHRKVAFDQLHDFKKESFKHSGLGTCELAVCLSGQLRGFSECSIFWDNFTYKNNAPIFLSTWERVGIPKGEHGNKLQRLLPDDAPSIFNTMAYNKFKELFPTLYNSLEDLDAKNILKIVENNTNIEFANVSVLNEELIEENYQSKCYGDFNQFKMFYNINNVINDLLHYEVKNNIRFERVIWARPDYDLTNINIDNLNPNAVYAVGDFLLIIPRYALEYLLGGHSFFLKERERKADYVGQGPVLLNSFFSNVGIPVLSLSDDVSSKGLKSVRFPPSIFFKEASAVDFNDESINLELKFKSAYYSENFLKLMELYIKHSTYFNHDSHANYLRDAAIKSENGNLSLSLRLMSAANVIRPNGRLILNKINEYKGMIYGQ